MPEQTETAALLSNMGADSSQDMMKNEQAMAMVKTMMAGLYRGFHARDRRQGDQEQSSRVTGNRLTLLQMDFDKMLQDPRRSQKLNGSRRASRRCRACLG